MSEQNEKLIVTKFVLDGDTGQPVLSQMWERGNVGEFVAVHEGTLLTIYRVTFKDNSGLYGVPAKQTLFP